MNIPTLLTFLALHWQYFLPALMTLLSTAHTRLARWPVLAVLVKHASGWPMLRWVAVDIARIVVKNWGPSVPDLQVQEDKTLDSLSGHLTPQEIGVLKAAFAEPEPMKNARLDGAGGE